MTLVQNSPTIRTPAWQNPFSRKNKAHWGFALAPYFMVLAIGATAAAIAQDNINPIPATELFTKVGLSSTPAPD